MQGGNDDAVGPLPLSTCLPGALSGFDAANRQSQAHGTPWRMNLERQCCRVRLALFVASACLEIHRPLPIEEEDSDED